MGGMRERVVRGIVAVLLLGLLCGPLTPFPPLARAQKAQVMGRVAEGIGVVSQSGYATPISDPSGIRLLVVLNGVGDFTAHPAVPEPAGGRWITLDLTVMNVGTSDFNLGPSNFQILSGNATIFQASTDDNLPQPQFTPAVLPAGQTLRGTVIFNIPAGQTLQSALFQAAGTTQFVIAPIVR
jgi:hypothetical protein